MIILNNIISPNETMGPLFCIYSFYSCDRIAFNEEKKHFNYILQMK